MHGWTKKAKRFLFWLVTTAAALVVLFLFVAGFVVWSLIQPPSDQFGKVEDEAKLARRDVSSLPAATEPYFAEMDKGLLKGIEGGEYPQEIRQIAAATGLDPEAIRQAAIRGQNAWIVWTGGNDRFWDFAARNTIGAFDLLKTVSSHPSQAYGRDNRFRYLGLVNEPGFDEATGPDPKHFGLWLDQRRTDTPPDPFGGNPDADRRYPGVEVGARGKPVEFEAREVTLPVGSYYGEPTGVMGLRLFPNPDFDLKASKKWDPDRYYNDPSYYNDKDLVRPYRVGMSCAFCHVGPNPITPPADVERPQFSQITSNPGAQYFWVDRIFFWNTQPRGEDDKPTSNEGNFLFQLFHTNPPGSLDTSLVSSDYINNPRTMNAVYETVARLGIASGTGWENLTGDELANKQFQDYSQTAALHAFFNKRDGKSASMRVLKDGADSVGTLGALNRVYLNIGLFSEEWLLHFRPFLGGQKISPIRVPDAQKNSVYWQATETMTADMAIFFLVTGRSDLLKDAPGGKELLAALDQQQVARGRDVFAENCAACHSSKQPKAPAEFGVGEGICEGGGAGPQYRECWDRYWAWAQSAQFKQLMRAQAEKPDFLVDNYLSNERRVPIDLVRTNACSAIATNGLAGDIWDNFTSSTYKTLPAPKEVTVHHPVSGAATPMQSPGNGRGYLRPPSLISLWSTAPYLLNNSVGHEIPYSYPRYGKDTESGPVGTSGTQANSGNGNYPRSPSACPAADPKDPYMPCIENRLSAFDTSIRQMLSPETRRMDKATEEAVPGYIYRTSAPSCLIIPKGFVPDQIRPFSGLLSRIAPWAFKDDGSIALGPFPSGFPVNALVNTKLLPDHDEDAWPVYKRLITNGPGLVSAFAELGGQCSAQELADPAVRSHSETVVRETGLIDRLVTLSKCPDYVVNAGHAFGSDLSQADKDALISFLKQL
ncbi:c-type cytochrome [Rhizobium sp. NFR12]|uniref:c-type cytochrome n=1 Tax=Rhizobium sp. NFR12 TaxID=1566261 RepID=UPI0008A7BAA1|nr:c-type cytochrome [Rhizobium sp. NFR12]SEH29985.1 Cytochrome c [Rhizobium sp. NFR12]